MKSDVMLFVRDVEASSAWYQRLLGARSGHGGPEYEMIVDNEGNLLFQFHRLDGDEHGINLDEDASPRGAGVLVYVTVTDVNEVYDRALALSASVSGKPAFIELAGHTEFIVNDPDGYALAICTRGNHER
ncbi:MAG: VOC family protein [Pseudomonadales bacterium]|nr:VOC family protein [Pseudomonadales bacterium]